MSAREPNLERVCAIARPDTGAVMTDGGVVKEATTRQRR
jgi:hypothetical protein